MLGRKFRRLLDPSGGSVFEVEVLEDPEQWGVWYVDVRVTASGRLASDSVYGAMMRAAGVEDRAAVEGGHPVTGLSDEEVDDVLVEMGWRRVGLWADRRAPVELLGVRVVDG